MSRIDRALNPGRYDGAAAPPADTVLCVPAHPQYPPDLQPRIVFELLEGPTGPVPVAFTSPRLLVERLGAAQPWVAASAEWFVGLMRRAGLGAVHLDPQTDPTARRWTSTDLAEYRKEA
ncbi:SAV_915 family protein [Streptacidiphilus sp. N1-10]|uniref:SAV_915 family protein n=1 Tax=Streptacidiphilus jeojiensis TaxID=3229225 RepID=A0ABV6XT80_9ACTN